MVVEVEVEVEVVVADRAPLGVDVTPDQPLSSQATAPMAIRVRRTMGTRRRRCFLRRSFAASCVRSARG